MYQRFNGAQRRVCHWYCQLRPHESTGLTPTQLVFFCPYCWGWNDGLFSPLFCSVFCLVLSLEESTITANSRVRPAPCQHINIMRRKEGTVYETTNNFFRGVLCTYTFSQTCSFPIVCSYRIFVYLVCNPPLQVHIRMSVDRCDHGKNSPHCVSYILPVSHK